MKFRDLIALIDLYISRIIWNIAIRFPTVIYMHLMFDKTSKISKTLIQVFILKYSVPFGDENVLVKNKISKRKFQIFSLIMLMGLYNYNK